MIFYCHRFHTFISVQSPDWPSHTFSVDYICGEKNWIYSLAFYFVVNNDIPNCLISCENLEMQNY